MDILKIKTIIIEILKRKNLNIIIQNDDILYPNYFSSLEMVELLLIIDSYNDEYKIAKIDLQNLTINKILEFYNNKKVSNFNINKSKELTNKNIII